MSNAVGSQSSHRLSARPQLRNTRRHRASPPV